jgi:hypothetical protein
VNLHSGVLCIQCRQARGGILQVAISVRACMPGNGFSLREPGRYTGAYWHTLFYFDLGCQWGSLETNVAGWCHSASAIEWSQTRFGHARGERSRPPGHFKVHRHGDNSVRPLKTASAWVGAPRPGPPGPFAPWLVRMVLVPGPQPHACKLHGPCVCSPLSGPTYGT